MSDSLTRFGGLAAGYDRYRPDYPAAAIDFVIERCGLKRGARLIDVGCGTGISTRLFAARGLVGVGIEPNADMRRVAETTPCPDGPRPTYRNGRADALDVPDASADLILAAQAFHWFANDAALHEFSRVLVRGGWVVLMWNDVDREHSFTGAFARALVETSPEPKIAAWRQSETGEVLLNSPLFTKPERREFPHEQALDLDGLLGRAFSASFAPKTGEPRAQLEARLRAAFDEHQHGGRATMRYRTVVFVAQKR
jgi:ubiquinone/menaquinone biosynthesis C-methylase UbiE